VNGYTPYKDQPPRAFWRKSISNTPIAEVDPVGDFSLRLDRSTKVATAGSCFAQHIAQRLQAAGYNYFVAEQAHKTVPPEVAKRYNYGVFSARYGNLYTARQLLQLVQRAYGELTPIEDVWHDNGRWIDPFRPQIQPEGFASEREFRLDRELHFAAVRRMLTELDVFVFTLGLTECWASREDGTVFPLCPGVSGGAYDPGRHVLHNFRVAEVVADMRKFLVRLRELNPRSKVILTVSPVPLVATATTQHVLSATTYSKSVLRAAAGELAESEEEVHYFPSYEIITGCYNRGTYYQDDKREVAPHGVDHVMRLFFAHATNEGDVVPVGPMADVPAGDSNEAAQRRVEEAVSIVCEEMALDGQRRDVSQKH